MFPPTRQTRLAPGSAAAEVSNQDLIGFTTSQCRIAAHRYALSDRERDVLYLSLCDKCPSEIAMTLGCETGYVRNIRQRILSAS
jgi:DNA-binding NarL/FixJ family response regulator